MVAGVGIAPTYADFQPAAHLSKPSSVKERRNQTVRRQKPDGLVVDLESGILNPESEIKIEWSLREVLRLGPPVINRELCF